MSQRLRNFSFVSGRGPYALDCRCVADVGDPTECAKQSFAESCDVNRIVSQYYRTGVLPGAGSDPPRFEDVSDVLDYRRSLELVMTARAAFDSQPAEVRRRFDNSPIGMMDFLSDPSNRDEAVRLGLVNPPVVEAQSGLPATSAEGRPDSVIP